MAKHLKVLEGNLTLNVQGQGLIELQLNRSEFILKGKKNLKLNAFSVSTNVLFYCAQWPIIKCHVSDKTNSRGFVDYICSCIVSLQNTEYFTHRSIQSVTL